MRDPERDLDPARRRILARTIRFNFGSRYDQRIEIRYRRHLPHGESIGRCRTYEVALAMMEAGLGVVLVPLSSACPGARPLFAVSLYTVPDLDRRIPALPPWVRLRFDPVRGRHVLPAPERVPFACPIAVAVLERPGEGRRFGDPVETLAAEFDAPREVIARDVRAMTEDLLARDFLTLRPSETVDG